jgi:hypothetical protein
VSTPDSFIDEVNEAVRRDRLFAIFRRYGWIGGLVILLIVGGAAWTEWTKAREQARAQAFGDALLDAIDLGSPQDRLSALRAIPASGGQVAIRDFLIASAAADDKTAALAALDRLAADPNVPQVYRDLAVLKKVLVAGKDMTVADRQAALAAIDVPGRPLRVLAEEQLAYLKLEEGKPAEALALLQTLYQDQEVPAAMVDRLGQAILALGGTLPERSAMPGATAATGNG